MSLSVTPRGEAPAGCVRGSALTWYTEITRWEPVCRLRGCGASIDRQKQVLYTLADRVSESLQKRIREDALFIMGTHRTAESALPGL